MPPDTGQGRGRMKGQALALSPLLGTQRGTPKRHAFPPYPEEWPVFPDGGEAEEEPAPGGVAMDGGTRPRLLWAPPGSLGRPRGTARAPRHREEHRGLLSLCKAGSGVQVTFQSQSYKLRAQRVTLLRIPWPLRALGWAHLQPWPGPESGNQGSWVLGLQCGGSSVRAPGLSISGVGAWASDTRSEVLAMEDQMLER